MSVGKEVCFLAVFVMKVNCNLYAFWPLLLRNIKVVFFGFVFHSKKRKNLNEFGCTEY